MNQWAAARMGFLYPTGSTKWIFGGAMALNIFIFSAAPFLGKARLSVENGFIEMGRLRYC